MTEFANFAKWAKKQDPKTIDWEMAKKDFPNYDIARFMADLGVTPDVSRETPEAAKTINLFPESWGIEGTATKPPDRLFGSFKGPDLKGEFTKGGEPVTSIPQILGNVGIGLAEMTVNTPAFLEEIIRNPASLKTMPKDIVTPAAKLAAAATVSGESPQATAFARQTYKESMENPEGLLMPLLVAKGGAKLATKGISKIGSKIEELASRPFPASPKPIAEAVKPEAPIVTESPLKPIPETPQKPVGATSAPPAPIEIAKLSSESGAVLNPISEIADMTSKMIEQAKTPPEIKTGVIEAKKAMIQHDVNIRDAEFVSKKMERAFDKVTPDKTRQQLIINAVEQKHNPKYYDQLNEFEKGIVKWMDGELDKLDRFVKDNNILEVMPEQEGIRHVFHWWQNPKTGEAFSSMYGKFSKGLPQAKQRVIPTYEKGIELGFQPVTTNLGKIVGQTWESVMRAQQSREMFKSLYSINAEKGQTIELVKGKTPKPIRMIERWDLLNKQGLGEDYVRYDNPILDKAITFKPPDGKLRTLKGAIGVRKELFPFVQAYIESPNYGTLSNINFAAKSMKLGLSLFHVQSLAMQELANWRIPYKNIPRGLRYIKDLPPEMHELYKQGLDLWKGYEDTGYRNKFFGGESTIAKLGNQATKPVEAMRHFIFDIVQPGMKASFAYDRYIRGLDKALKQGLTKDQWAREVVEMADGHFSHEHYKRSLLETNRWVTQTLFTPKARKFWQNLLLSVTWQREHLRIAGNVSKSFMPDKLIEKSHLKPISKVAKADYRKYAYGAVAMVAAVDLWNLSATKQMDGEYKHIWQNPSGKGFAVRAWWNEPSYKVNNKTIKGGAAYIRPLKSVYEVAEWANDPLAKFVNKLSPALSAIGQQFWPDEYRNYEKGWAGYPERGKDVISDLFMPISIGQVGSAIEGKREPEAVILPFLGMPTSKVVDKRQNQIFYR